MTANNEGKLEFLKGNLPQC